MGAAYRPLVIAALILAIVLIVAFMQLQLYRLESGESEAELTGGGGDAGEPAGSREPTRGRAPPASAPVPKESLSGTYSPTCSVGGPYVPSGGNWMGRHACRGLTAGKMPAIELEGPVAKLVCCGRFGVPPPTGEPSNASRAN